jgi:SAM-dependent methyltransferase
LNASGTLVFPAVPGLQGTYVAMSEALFRALGRSVSLEQSRELLEQFADVMKDAFDRSQRSNVVLTYEAPSGKPLKYSLTAEPIELPEAYEQWHSVLHEELFGEFPDARLLTLLEQEAVEKPGPILDLGAGLGRNAFALATRGYSVDAVELSPSFVAAMTKEASKRRLPFRVFERNLFSGVEGLERDYRLVLASGLVGDLRSQEQLRHLFELSSSLLVPGGLLVVNIHFVSEHFEADDADRNWAQQCCSMFYNPFEVALAIQDLPLELIAADDAYQFERTHLPEEHWPVTPAFVEWATGRHLHAVEQKHCPVTLKWLVMRKLDVETSDQSSATNA